MNTPTQTAKQTFHPMQTFKHLQNRLKTARNKRDHAIVDLRKANEELEKLKKEFGELAPQLDGFRECQKAAVQIARS